jgi:hypothetical protein
MKFVVFNPTIMHLRWKRSEINILRGLPSDRSFIIADGVWVGEYSYRKLFDADCTLELRVRKCYI